jgi:predicted acylesterase/phospholipase RssA
MGATALAGLFPPYVRDGRRLIDGVALVPVPTDAVADLGADVTLSVNILSRDVLDAWPGQDATEPPAPARQSLLATLLEVLELAQLEASTQHAAKADVVVTPRFGPGSWQDFHLADLFLAAGRVGARESLDALGAMSRPQFGNR